MTSTNERQSGTMQKLMSPLRIRLNSIGIMLLAAFVFWIGLTLKGELSERYFWIFVVAFIGIAIIAVWGFVIAQRRQWWIDQQNNVGDHDGFDTM